MKVLSAVIRVLSGLVYIVIAAALLIVSPVLFGYRPVVILSGSMEPAYPVGGITYYKAAGFNDIDVGDAITYEIGGGSLATHRVMGKDEGNQSFTTKGDDNPSLDANPVPYSSVVGKTTRFVIPYAGYITDYVRKWYVIAIMGSVLLIGMFTAPDGKKKTKKKPGEGIQPSPGNPHQTRAGARGADTDGQAGRDAQVPAPKGHTARNDIYSEGMNAARAPYPRPQAGQPLHEQKTDLVNTGGSSAPYEAQEPVEIYPSEAVKPERPETEPHYRGEHSASGREKDSGKRKRTTSAKEYFKDL